MKKILVFLHKWLGVVLAVFFLVWFASGIVLYFVPFPSLGQTERLAGLPPLEVPAGCCLSAQEAAQRAGLHFTEARLGMHGPTPVWRLLAPDGGRPRWRTVEAGTGTLLPMLGPEEAAAVAAAFSQRQAVQTDMLERDQWTVAQGLDSHRPLFKVALDGADGLELYVSPGAGEVVRDTRRSERFWNWLGAVPHWIYPTVLRQFPKVWHQVVVWTSIAAVLLAATGLLLGVWQLFLNRNRWIPYRKFWMRWHHIAGLVAAIFTLTWIFSGLMSMNPFGVFSSRGVPSSERMQWLGAAAPALDNPAAAVRQARAHGLALRELDVVQVAGQAWYRQRDAERQLLVRAEVGAAAQEPVAAVPDATVLAALAGLRSEVGMPAVGRLDAYDGMYYARHPGSPDVRHTRPLPVWHAEWSDGVAVYADPASARILLRADPSTQWQRVLYNGLHSFDFAPLLAWPWVRHGLVVGLSLLGLALCITSCVLAWRVLVPRVPRSAAARRTIAQGER